MVYAITSNKVAWCPKLALAVIIIYSPLERQGKKKSGDSRQAAVVYTFLFATFLFSFFRLWLAQEQSIWGYGIENCHIFTGKPLYSVPDLTLHKSFTCGEDVQLDTEVAHLGEGGGGGGGLFAKPEMLFERSVVWRAKRSVHTVRH